MREMILADWRGILGKAVFDFAQDGVQRVELDVVSEGCTVIVLNEGVTHVVGHGDGAMRCAFVARGPFSVGFEGWSPDTRISFRVPQERLVPTGWAEGDAFVQLDLKSRDEMTPELRDMFAAMNRNSLLREQKLREEIQRLIADRKS